MPNDQSAPPAALPAQPITIATQAMVHATALAMANATHSQGCIRQINAAAAGALVALIMQAGTTPQPQAALRRGAGEHRDG
jgi:hypothetical protein